MKRIVTRMLIIIVLYSLISLHLTTNTQALSGTPIYNDSVLYFHSAPILIESNEEFETADFPGSGTAEDPYLIQDLEIYPNQDCITIRNTRVHFKIENCVFRSHEEYAGIYYNGIVLENVSNGIVTECTITVLGRALGAFDSINCTIIGNNIQYSGAGVYLVRTHEFTITDNILAYSSWGITVFGNNTSIIDNTIVYNNRESIHLYGCHNRVIGNRIGWNEYRNAIDHGDYNQWDDNISQGNAWHDYSGVGEYQIHSGSVDHFPSTLSGDYRRPSIYHVTVLEGVKAGGPPLQSLTFEANVNDSTAVDTVLFWYRVSFGEWLSAEMVHVPIPGYPNRYIYDIPGPIYTIGFAYRYWANDTLGISSETMKWWFFIRTYPDYWPRWILGFFVGMGTVVVCAEICVHIERYARSK